MRTFSVNIPFAGFYESKYSGEIDSQETQFCEWEADESDRETGEQNQPEHLRLTSGELCEIMWLCASYGIAYNKIAREYVASFDIYFSELLGFPLGLTFEEMTSPREYNFETDRLFATMPAAAVAKLWRMSRADGHKMLAKYLKDRFTSYDGFSSHYRNTLDAWPSRPSEWDHNELGTLLLACLEIAGAEQEWDWHIYEHMAESNDFYTAFESCVDWEKFEDMRKEAREEKAREYAEEHPEEPTPNPWKLWYPYPGQLTFGFYA